MKISELYAYIEQAMGENKQNADCDVEFWLHLQDTQVICELESIGQFNVIPDMTITIKPNDNKIYSSKELSKEELEFKQKYENLQKRIEKVSYILLNNN